MKQVWKPTTLLGPIPPALITCGSMEKPNVLTAAWVGIINTKPPMCYISLRPERYSAPIIKESGVFCINLPTQQLVKSVDFCGVRSGKNTDKFSICKLSASEGASGVPMLNESPISLECRVNKIIPLGSHEMYLADITAVHVEESLLDETGKLHIERANLLAFAHGGYYSLGKQLGTFGYSVRKKKAARPATAKKQSVKRGKETK